MDEATKQLHDQLPEELKDVFFGNKDKPPTPQQKEESAYEMLKKTLEAIKKINNR